VCKDADDKMLMIILLLLIVLGMWRVSAGVWPLHISMKVYCASSVSLLSQSAV